MRIIIDRDIELKPLEIFDAQRYFLILLTTKGITSANGSLLCKPLKRLPIHSNMLLPS